MRRTAPSSKIVNGQFASTRWTVVLAADNSQCSAAHAHDALAELCHIYWRPLYFFLRREGVGTDDAQDLTQAFFAELIRDRTYRRATPEKGRFRSFLLGALKHFLSDARAREQVQKRGGGIPPALFDEEAIAELEAQVLISGDSDASALFEREWAAALLRRTFERLSDECVIAGKATLFDQLRLYLSGTSDEAIPYEELSQQLQRRPVTLRSDVARLRLRYRTILREEVAGTVSEPGEVDDELRYLCRVLAHA